MDQYGESRLDNRFKDWAKSDFTIPAILDAILQDISKWEFFDNTGKPWYRGQRLTCSPKPSLFRGNYDEFNMTTMFRNRSAAFSEPPETDRIDKWLFIMQHYDLPTRLLDWTESPLTALYFALESYLESTKEEQDKNKPTLFIIHPYELNKFSGLHGLPNTWTRKNNLRLKSFFDGVPIDGEKKVEDDAHVKKQKKLNHNPGLEYFRLAFTKENM